MLPIEIRVHTLTKTYVITGSHLSSDGVTFDNYCMSGEFIQYGSTVSPQLEFSYWEDLMPGIDWKAVSHVEYYSNSKKIFSGIVEEAKSSDELVDVIVLGLMSKLDEELYVPEIHTNIFTSRNAVDIVKNCLSYIISKNPTLGHTIVSKYSIANMPVVTKITEETVKGATLGDFVRWALEIMGAVLIEEKGTFNITTPSNTVLKTFDQSVIYDPLVVNEEELTISGVIIVAQEVKSKEEGESEYVGKELLAGTNYRPVIINDNPFAFENATQAWADTLFARDKGLTWRPITVDIDFDVAYDLPLMSMINVSDRFGNNYNTLITKLDLSHGDRVSVESVGMNWKPEVKTIGSPVHRSAELERRLIDNNLALIRDRFRNNLQEVLGNLEQETQDRIKSVNDAIEIAKNSPVTSTRITENAIQTSHIAADAVTATTLKVDQALIDKLTLTSLLADTIWTKTLSAKQISSEQIYVTQAFIDALFVDMMKAGSITTEMLSSDVGQSLDLSSNESVNIMVGEKGKYRNLIPNSDGFVASSGYRFVMKEHPNGNITDPKAGSIVVRDSDNSLGTATDWGTGTYHYNVPLEVTKKVDNYTLWIGNFFKSDYVTDVTVAMIDKNGYHYSYTSTSVNANSVIKLLKNPNTQSTVELAYLRFKVTISQTPTPQGIRIYPEQIALVEGDVDKLNWSMTYLSSNNAMIDITTKEILQQVGDSYMKMNASGIIQVGGKDISISGNQVTLNGNTTVNGTFKLPSTNIADIAGWEISSTRLSKKTTSESHMTVLNSDRSLPYVMGTFQKDSSGSYNVTKWKIDWDGTLYARGADITGTINVTDGSIGGLSITSGGLVTSGTNYYAHVSSTSSYPFFAGPSSNSSNFRVTKEGILTAKGADITGTINVTDGSVGGLSITSGGLVTSGTNYYAHVSSTSSYPFFAGPSSNSSNFRVTKEGILTAKGADITGTINVTDGSVGGLSITSGGLVTSGTNYYAHVSSTSSYPFFAGPSSSSSRFRVSRDGDVLARSITLSGGQIGGTTINSSSLSGGSFSSGSFTSGSYSGSSYGYGSFSSGSYTGSGYLASGSTLAGYSISDDGDYLRLSNLYVSGRFSTTDFVLGSGKIRGVYHSGAGGYMYASLGTTGWTITNSDIRLKENVKTMSDCTVKEIYTLPLIEYNYKSDETKVLNYGVNANLLMKILPEKFANSFIFKDKDSGLYGAKYEMLTPHLVKAVQDLNKRLERLENE